MELMFFQLLKRTCYLSWQALVLQLRKLKDKCLPVNATSSFQKLARLKLVRLEISVNRKPTFTGQFLRWEFFSPLNRKISLISTLVHQALMICTKRRLNDEREQIKRILLHNSYSKSVVNAEIAKKIAQFSTLKRFGPQKSPVYLRVPWIDKPLQTWKKEVKTIIESCYASINTTRFSRQSACYQ